MKFGKLDSIEGVDFTLPETPPATTAMLRQTDNRETPLELFIGATGWSMKEWVGKIYPPGTKPKDYLQHYSRQFNTIELNTTHYGIPKAETVEKWYRDSAADFSFCPKIPQSISHSRQLGLGSSLLRDFSERMSLLQEKLGCCFLQLPPHFGINRAVLLRSFLEQLPHGLPLAVEFRHESWFSGSPETVEFDSFLEEAGIGKVITDVAGRRDVLHHRLTTPVAMIRFVGNNLHPTDYTRIEAWIKKLQQWAEIGLKKVYFFTHEPDNLLAPDLAAHLLSRSSLIPDVAVRGPRIDSQDRQPGRQISLFE